VYSWVLIVPVQLICVGRGLLVGSTEDRLSDFVGQHDPIIDAESSDDGCSSVSDASFQVGKIALQSLLDIAQVSEKPSSKRAKRSPHSANKTTNAPKPAHAKRKSEPVIQDDISEATGGGKQALAELLSSL
jgi:hypothetical protein